jgi:hypothetical protein
MLLLLLLRPPPLQPWRLAMLPAPRQALRP